jgi:hypothetical protein
MFEIIVILTSIGFLAVEIVEFCEKCERYHITSRKDAHLDYQSGT